MGDRRRFPRLVAALDASYQVEGSVFGHRATLAAVSACGAAFVSEDALEPEFRLDFLVFSLGEELTTRTFRPAAKVVSCERRDGIGRQDEYLIAVEFTDFSPEETQELNDLILARLAREEAGYNPRIEIAKPVAVRFDRFDTFVEEVSENLSRTGMFIRSERPHPAGSEFDFVLQLGEDFALVQGHAEVVWTRAKGEGADRPPGMGIRFLNLDTTSENVLRRLVEAHVDSSYPRALETPAASDELPDLLDGDVDEAQNQ